jgi:hypothetical protein
MFRHMAILKFKPDAKQADIDSHFEAFPKLMVSLPVIKAWNIGRNQGTGGETHGKKHSFAPTYDVGLMMDFDSGADYLKYAESPEHQAFFAKYCVSILTDRVVAQFSKD